MTIVRITQEKSISHTEFAILQDYNVLPQQNFELAQEWAAKGLLDPFTASFIKLIENMQSYFTALRNVESVYARIRSGRAPAGALDGNASGA